MSHQSDEGTLIVASLSVVRTYRVSDAREILWRAQDLHDSSLCRVHYGEDRCLRFEISNPWWVISVEVYGPDRTTRFRFSLSDVHMVESWGSDIEICMSAIFDFYIDSDGFRFLTGDGGRSGTMDIADSLVEIVSSAEAVERFEIPI
jgi:hypothetical protein